jgi:cyclic dehypoxanthinyl futalosine synthase
MWSFQGKNTELLALIPDMEKPSSNRYLRLLAVARLYLDNVPNIQSSWVTQGPYIGQMALRFGANDLGSTMMEENVVSSAGAAYTMAKEEMVHLIEDIGEIAAIRNTAYETLQKFA